MYWANFLHFYQPPDQRRYMMEKIVNEGYRPLIHLLLKHPHARLTVNISGCLLDKLNEFGMDDVIGGFYTLAQNKQIELTASVKYHPFLPLTKQYEILRQIKLNNDTLRYYFKDLYKPFGFFSPEAGYSRELALLVASLGYKWLIADEIAYSGKLSFGQYDFSHTPGFYSGGLELYKIVGKVSGENSNSQVQSQKLKSGVNYTKLYTLKGRKNFFIFFRERIISDAIASGQIKTADQFLNIIKPEGVKHRFLFTGTDGEAYGHHQPELEQILGQLLSKKELKTVTISDLFKYFKSTGTADPVNSTWGTSEADISDGYYYSRWLDPRNLIHGMQWELTNLAIQMVEEAKGRGDPGYPVARHLLDQALYSCHFWWAAARPWWSIEIIERGSKYLIDVVNALQGPPKTKPKKEYLDRKIFLSQKRKAKGLYFQILTTAFDWLRKELVWDLSHQHK